MRSWLIQHVRHMIKLFPAQNRPAPGKNSDVLAPAGSVGCPANVVATHAALVVQAVDVDCL